MSNRTSNPPSSAQFETPLVVNIEGLSAGFAVPDRRGIRFVSAHPLFDMLDGTIFRELAHLINAAHKLASAH